MTGASGGRRAACRQMRRILAGGVASAVLLEAPAPAAEPAAGETSGFLGRLFDRVGQVWVVDAPGAAGSRFSLGANLFFEHQESLRIAAQTTTVTSPGPAGQPVVNVLVGDPELLGRKFDLTWEMAGVGVEVPVALPDLGGVVYPTLVLQAGGADLGLDFEDRTRPADSVSLTGQGALFGVGADLAAPLCAGCPWLAFAGFRYQWLPETGVDRAPPLDLGVPPEDPGAGLPLFEVLADETRLRREAREISARLAYGLPGARVVPFVGVRHRWTEVTVDDELAFRSSLGETRLDTRTRLEAEPTLGLTGFDFQLGPRLFGSFETSVGEEDYGAALRVVALLQGPGVSLQSPWPPTEPDPRSLEIASALALRLAEIEAAFLAGRAALTLIRGPDGGAAYLLVEVEALLARTETDLLAALAKYPELEALGDWVGDRFTEARVVLEGLPQPVAEARSGWTAGRSRAPVPTLAAAGAPPRPGTVTSFRGSVVHPSLVRLRGARLRFAQAPAGATVPRSRGDAALDVAERGVKRPRRLAEDGRLQTYLAFATTLVPGTRLRVFPRFNPSAAVVLPRNPARRRGRSPVGAWVFVGSYSFEVQPGPAGLRCDARSDSMPPCPLDLVSEPPSVLCCTEVECRPEECL